MSHTEPGKAEPEILYGCCLKSTDLLCYEAPTQAVETGGPGGEASSVMKAGPDTTNDAD